MVAPSTQSIPARGAAQAWRRATWEAAAWAMALPAALWLAVLLSGRVFTGVDMVRYDAPAMCALRQAWTMGSWSLVPESGLPLWADPQMQVANPLRWLWAWLPPDVGVTVHHGLHGVLAAGAMAWLLRTFGLGVAVSAGGGTAFGLSGVALDLLAKTTYAVGGVGLAAGWASIRLVLRGRTGVPLALVAFYLMVGTDPQVLAELSVVGVVELVSRETRRPGGPAHGVIRAGMWVVVGVLPALLVWWPASREMAISGRGEMGPDEVLRWSAGAPTLLSMLVPGYLEETWLWWDTSSAPALPWVRSAHLGAVGLVLAAAGALRPGPARWLFALWVLAALGEHNPVMVWLADWPTPLRWFRYPAKYLLPATAAAVVLAACGAQAVWRGRAVRLIHLTAVPLAVVLLGVAGAVLSQPGTLDPEGSARLVGECATGLLGLAVLVILARGPATRRMLTAAWWGAGMVLAAPNLVSIGGSYLGGATLAGHLSAGAAHDPPVLCHGMELAGVGFTDDGADARTGQAAFQYAVGVPALNQCSGIAGGVAYSLLQPGAAKVLANALDRRSMAAARALGCSHVVSLAPAWDEPATSTDAPIPGLHILGVPGPAPRVAVAGSPMLMDGEPAALSRVLASQGYQSMVGVTDDPMHRWPPGRPLPSGAGVRVDAVDRAAPDHWRFRTVGGPALVVVRTPFLVGWRAHGAGGPLPVLRAGANLVAVVVEEPGPVDLRYHTF